jgi:hypothetical protein
MNAGPYPDLTTVLLNVDRASFSASGGVWRFVSVNSDPGVVLLESGIANTQQALRLGDRFPIDASRYRLLSFRLCSSAATTANVNWFYDQAPHTVFAGSNFVTISAVASPNCALYVIDMTRIGALATFGGATGWNGTVRGLRLDPASTGSGIALHLDWVRLTTVDTTNTVPINWAGVTSGTTLFFYLAKDTDCSPVGATLIGTAPRTGSTGSFTWGAVLQPNPTLAMPRPLPESFQPGRYAVFMLVDNAGAPICGSTPLEIRQAPILTFQKPSPTSGPDYATEVNGDSWGMASAQDIGETTNIVGGTVSGGIFTGLTNASGDPHFFLSLAAPIDAQRYRYATFRMQLDGSQDIGAGSVSRLYWWFQGPTIDFVATRDIIVYEGFQTYTVDLTQALLEPTSLGPGWVGLPTAFRLDPHEFPASRTFRVDFVTLTGDDRVSPGNAFPIYYQTTPVSGVAVNLFYDTDTNPTNGRTPITLSSAPCPPDPTPELGLLTGVCRLWDTTGVANGPYFILAEVSDGAQMTQWYSETPVIVGPVAPPPALRPTMTSPTSGAQFSLQAPTPITFAWTAVQGAAQYFLEFTGPGRQFANPNGTVPDPANGWGGAGGGLTVAATTFTATLDSSVTPGTYQIRGIALSDNGQFLGTFSDAVTVILGSSSPPPAGGQITITAPASGSTFTRGSSVTFSWTALSGVTQYGFEFTGTNRQFANPNGTAPDAVNGFGGAGGGFAVAGTSLQVVLPLTIQPGSYQVRLIGLSAEGQLVGIFSNAVTVIIQ